MKGIWNPSSSIYILSEIPPFKIMSLMLEAGRWTHFVSIGSEVLFFSADRIRFGLTFLIVCKFMSSWFCPRLSLSWGEPRVEYYCDNIDNQCNPKYYPPLLLFLNWKITKTCLRIKQTRQLWISSCQDSDLVCYLWFWKAEFESTEQVSPTTDWSGCLVQHSCHSSSL